MDLNFLVSAAFKRARFRTIPLGEEAPRIKDSRLFIPQGLLQKTAEESFRRLSFYFRESHLELMAARLGLAESSANDRIAIQALLRNALIAAKGELALCQDTGTAVIYGWKDESVFTGVDDGAELEAGAAAAYKKNYLRASQVAFSSFFDEFNTGNNLPAQVRLEACGDGNSGPSYRFLFVAKGGGSSNKTSLFPMTKALLEKDRFEAFLEEKIKALGTAACPPYRIALVVGGPSPEFNLETLKLATAEALDAAPYLGEGEDETAPGPLIRRDRYWEDRVMEIGKRGGLGAQFGGTGLLLDARVLRLPRHAASCPVSIGVSCSAHRNILAFIDREGLHMEKLAETPEAFLRSRGIDPYAAQIVPQAAAGARIGEASVPRINLNRPLKDICAELSALSPGDKTLLSGKLLVARDAAHLKWRALLAGGSPLPGYLFKYPIYYAGPAASPPGKIIGSLGPTTAQRMDPYGDEFMSRGASLITLAKGNRTALWQKACKTYGGFYLGTIGGAAALLAEENVVSNELLDYPELGMEAVRLIEVRDLLAFIIIDDKGKSLY